MGDLSVTDVKDYTTFRQAFGEELTKASQSFVRIGYLLKRARDEAGLLADSGYTDIIDFAREEFGLDRSQVSRFMRINDRFSVNGYSEYLESKYEQFGSSKLSLMLLLPDEINEEISPDYSKSDINAIKTEYEAEKKISDLEVMMEEKSGPDEFIAAVVKELNDEHPDPVRMFHESCVMAEKLKVVPDAADAKEAFMPDGDRTYNIRISGQGRFMINMKTDGITVVNMRDPSQKSPVSWEEFFEVLKADMATRDFKIEEEKPKEKPKKVEPAKPKNVAPEQTAKTLKAEPDVEQCQDNVAPTAGQPADPVDVWKDDATGPDGSDQAVDEASPAAGFEEKQLTAFQKQIIDKLGMVQNVIGAMETTKENWEKVNDMLRDTIRTINCTVF